jgi:HPt (histidine-containing phosphotransfer) domain-containing protein
MESNQNRKKAIDTEFLRSIIENDVEFEKELFAIFSENAHRNITKMEDAVKSGDNNSWYMASHAFKGASASIGAFDLSKVLEHAQKHPEGAVAEKSEVLKKVKEEFRLVLDFINEELLEK